MNARTRRRDTSDVQFNLTPLIDIVFQLIIFFMLLSQFAGLEKTPVDLPTLTQGKAEVVKPEDKVVLTIDYTPGMESDESLRPEYRVGPVVVGSFEDVTRRLRQAYDYMPEVELVIRAHKQLPYRSVREVLQAAGRIGIQTVQVTVAIE